MNKTQEHNNDGTMKENKNKKWGMGPVGGLAMDSVPNKGIASETCGRVSATKLRKTVSDSRIVTPVTKC